MNDKRLTVRYTQLEYDKLYSLATRSGQSMNDIMLVAIDELSERYEQGVDKLVLKVAQRRVGTEMAVAS